MSNARFSRDRFNKCDAKGKTWSKLLLKSLYLTGIEESPAQNSKYDMKALEDDKVLKFEVEVKQDWGVKWPVRKSGDEWTVNGKPCPFPFPYGDIRFAARKKTNPVDYFVTFSGCGKFALLAVASDVQSSPTGDVDNKHMRKEPFLIFDLVPRNRFAFFEKEDGEFKMVAHHAGTKPRVSKLSVLFSSDSTSVFDLFGL